MILKKKKFDFGKELAKNRNKPKEPWKSLTSLSLSSNKANKLKISIKKDPTIQIKTLKNPNIFERFYYEVVGDLQDKLPKAPNKFTSQTTKNYYAKASCNVSNDIEMWNVFEEFNKKILLGLDTSEAAGIDQIPAKFLKDGAGVLSLPLRNGSSYSRMEDSL